MYVLEFWHYILNCCPVFGDHYNQSGLIHAFILDGKGYATELGWDDINSWEPEQGIIWLHFDYSADNARKWILENSRIDDIAANYLIAEDTRPRTTFIDDSILMALRGVNLNPGSEPEDMVSIRIWVNKHQIITTRNRVILSAGDIAKSFETGKGPKTSGDFITILTGKLISRMENTIEELEERAFELEEKVISSGSHILRAELSAIRRETIMLRRYLAPQREALLKLCSEKVSWLNDSYCFRIRESTDQLIRYIEDLDSIKDKASVTQEELVNQLTEQMNTRMYLLSLVAAIFLPLGFFTGLLGVNVGGIPGAENKLGFSLFILFIALITLIQILFFKKKSGFDAFLLRKILTI